MIDIKLLQRDFDTVATALQKKGVDNEVLNNLKNLASKAKDKRQEMEDTTAAQNNLSKEFGRYKKENLDITALQEEINQLKTKKQDLEEEVRVLEEELTSIALCVPNMPDESVPYGKDEDENVVLEVVGVKPEFSFEPKEHWDLNNGWLDFERGVKLAKSRFSAIKGQGARLERALINYMLDFNRERGFEEWYVPFMANTNTLQGTGQLPKFADDLFKIEGEDLYLIPTAEVSLTNLYNDEILEESELPLLLTSYTPCFRKEAGSAGRDTRGLIRQHQFDKVEMVCFAKQEDSKKMHDEMVSIEEEIRQGLGIPYQKVNICSGDLWNPALKKYDLEAWMPGQGKYREVTSCSNVWEYQSRRLGIRYRDDEWKTKYVHTLNGTVIALSRCLIAIIENYQTAEGDVRIPEVLRPFMWGREIL